MKQLYTIEDVEQAAKRLSHAIHSAYASETELFFVGILNGGVEFMFRLLHYVRKRGLSYSYGFMAIDSYKGADHRVAPPRITYCSLPRLDNHVAIIIDDIVDGGNTMILAKNHVELFCPKKIETVSLLYKPGAAYTPDRFGLMVDRDCFVVGTGMGIGEKHRDKPGIWICDDASIKEIVQ